jgi:hypothetical protein
MKHRRIAEIEGTQLLEPTAQWFLRFWLDEILNISSTFPIVICKLASSRQGQHELRHIFLSIAIPFSRLIDQ